MVRCKHYRSRLSATKGGSFYLSRLLGLKFSQAKEINSLYHESPLEDTLRAELKHQNLPAKRQVVLPTKEKNWICDFAFYCAKGNVDVECDGDTYHMHPEAVRYDKGRNDEIAAVANWHILHFTTRNSQEEMPQTMQLIKTKIDRLGGLHYAQKGVVRYVANPQCPTQFIRLSGKRN